MKASIKQISQLTGFSPATVSNALNHKRGVNAETAEKIFKCAQELGYFEENHVTKVKFVTFKQNGKVVEETPFFPLMIAGAEQECRACGMEMVICNLDKRKPNFEEQMRWVFNDRSSAVILLGTEMTDDDLDLIQNISVPFVLIDYWHEKMLFDAVLINNEDSARMATEYLISKGHREIGYLRGNFRIKPFRTRYMGYQTAMQRAKLPMNADYRISLSTTMDGAYGDMKKYLATNPKLPTAFFADNDIIALGAIKAMTEQGIRIPEDISIIGFDDLSFASISNPPLTTIRVSKQDIGRMAVRRLAEKIRSKDDIHLKIQVCTQFVERKSVMDINE